MQKAGCFAIVLESVIPEVAREVTDLLDIPTIGIGCGDATCEGSENCASCESVPPR